MDKSKVPRFYGPPCSTTFNSKRLWVAA